MPRTLDHIALPPFRDFLPLDEFSLRRRNAGEEILITKNLQCFLPFIARRFLLR